MSGIVGIFNLDGRPADRGLLQAMLAVEEFRGPDEEGLWVQGPVGLGHRQLRTTSESLNEHQPVCLDGGRYVLTCDGRVDNREELIQALKGKAPVGKSTPDADLVLHAYIAWEADCLKRIVGDFAFVIWDERKQELFCARDRLGLRPFNYYYDGRRFLFGSDINSLLQHREVPRGLNETMIGLYLSGGFGDGEETFYKGINQVPQGYFLRVTVGGLVKNLYWELEADNPILLANDEEYVEQFLHLFQEAVRCRLRSTGTVATTLSGGLDSGSIICTAQSMINMDQAPNIRLQGFSSVFTEFASADESKYIQEIADRYQLESYTLDSDNYWSFKSLQGSFPIPNHPFPIPHQARHEALLHEIRRSGTRVVLTGEGGDEILFARAESLIWHLLINRKLVTLRHELKRFTPKWRRRFYKQVLVALAPGWMGSAYNGVKAPLGVFCERLSPISWQPGTRGTDGDIDYPIIDAEFAKRINLDQRVKEVLRSRKFESPYYQAQYNTVKWFGQTYFLSYYAQMAQWHGVEARFPFLDTRLVDFVCRIPPEQKVSRQGRSKWLLRQAMQGILPETIRLRPDKGDFTPLFFRGLEELKVSGFERYLQNGNLVRMGLVDRDRLVRLFTSATSGRPFPIIRLISFVSLEHWLHQYLEGSGSGVAAKSVLPIINEKGGDRFG